MVKFFLFFIRKAKFPQLNHEIKVVETCIKLFEEMGYLIFSFPPGIITLCLDYTSLKRSLTETEPNQTILQCFIIIKSAT